MSYDGKTYKKVKMENVIELLEKLNTEEKVINLFKHDVTVSFFKKNDDGSIQFHLKKGDEITISQKLENNKEIDIKSPNGETVKSFTTIDGDTVKTVMTTADGKVFNWDRYFEGDKLKAEIHSPGVDIKGVIYYEAI